MKKNYPKFINFLYHLVSPLVNPKKIARIFPEYFRFFRDLINYSKMEEAERISFFDLIPSLFEKTATPPFDSHYFYQDIWAFKKILQSKVEHHIDVGSRIDFVGFLSTITKVTFLDIRPLTVNLENFESKKGDILSLPFKDNSIFSLSCLHVAEHIGLGRYGDSLNPLGTREACKELARVLAKGGNLYFSVPVGRPRLYFNAHRVYSVNQILQYFNGLKLVEFSGIDDQGIFRENLDINSLENSNYACGLFWFKK